MAVPRMIPDRCALFIVDVQTNLLPDIVNAERMVIRCALLTHVATTLGMPVLITEQVKRVFGETHPEIKDRLPDNTPIIEKSRFSACIDEIDERLQKLARPDVIVCGMEAHICIMQTSLDLLDRGKGVFLATDAISSGEADQIEPSFRRLMQAGAVPTGAVSATYELLADARNPLFKSCLEMVKKVRASK